jgi:hypothetical protein
VRQRPHSASNKFFHQITTTTHTSCVAKGLLVLIPLHHLVLWKYVITMGAQNNRGQARQPFDVARHLIKPEIPPVTPLILRTWYNLNHFSQSILGPRREGARTKLSNQATYLPLLLVHTIFFCKDLNRWLSTV